MAIIQPKQTTMHIKKWWKNPDQRAEVIAKISASTHNTMSEKGKKSLQYKDQKIRDFLQVFKLSKTLGGISAVNHKTRCLLWYGYYDHTQHGVIVYQGKKHYVHRLAYELWYGKKPEYYIAHTCPENDKYETSGPNKLCINPRHLIDTPDKSLY